MRPLAPRTPPRCRQSRASLPATSRGAADPRAGDRRYARRGARLPSRDARLRRGRRPKGGVYGVTRGLQARFGEERVFDTLLDETSILGLALGAGISGFVPIPEIQYLAYLHNAEDQLRGEAATLQFFSQGAYRNGMVVRIQGYGYQKGFGGHFHNDNGIGVLRDVPGLVIASPARPDDAAAMLADLRRGGEGRRQRLRVPRADRALPHPRPARGRRRALARRAGGRSTCRSALRTRIVAATTSRSSPGRTACYLSLRVARRLRERGIGVSVVDLRWLAPLPMDEVLREATGHGPDARRGRDAPYGRCGGGDRRGAPRRRLPRAARARRRARTRSCRSVMPPSSCSSRRARSRPPRCASWLTSTGAMRPRQSLSRRAWSRPSSRAAQSRSTIQTTTPRRPPRQRSPEPRARPEYSTRGRVKRA